LPSSALPPPEIANGEGGPVGASVPPVGACASALAGAAAARAVRHNTIRVVRRLMAFSDAYEVS
jgi:hypothetical protein